MTQCSESSLSAHETMAGTAGDALRHWIGVEVRGVWRNKCVVDNDLPEPVQAWLRELSATPGVRPVLLKQRGKRHGVTVLYADVIDGRVHRFDLADHAFVHRLPWAELMAGEVGLGRTDERPILVCTHGTRDHCCGLHGPALYRALTQLAGARVWQCSHLGGHRFAATAVALPEGVHYGRLRADEAPELLAALGKGALHRLDRFRGRTWLPRPVQAAESWLRERGDLLGFDDVIINAWAEDGDALVVILEHRGERHRLRVRQIDGDATRAASCGADPTPAVAWDTSPIADEA